MASKAWPQPPVGMLVSRFSLLRGMTKSEANEQRGGAYRKCH